MPTYTDDEQLLRYVEEYKAALDAQIKHQVTRPPLDPLGQFTYQDQATRLIEELQAAEARLCAAFVWALEQH